MSNNKPLRFWEVDLLEWAKQTLIDLFVLAQFTSVFLFLTLPVVIPGLLMWGFQILTGRPLVAALPPPPPRFPISPELPFLWQYWQSLPSHCLPCPAPAPCSAPRRHCPPRTSSTRCCPSWNTTPRR